MFVRRTKPKSDDAAAALNAALRILTRREYSKLELYNKLLERYTKEAARQALKKCMEENWQSEERYAQMLFNHLKNSLYGPKKIAMQMMVKGVKPEFYQQYIDETNWCEVAASFIKKKASESIKNMSFEDRQKLLSSVARRGFSNSDCLEALKTASASFSED